MDWIQLSIQTTTAGIEPVCGRLYRLGLTGLEIEDAADFNDFLQNSRDYWDYVDDSLMSKATAPTCVKAYLGCNPGGFELLGEIRSSLAQLAVLDTEREFGTLHLALVNMSEQDWAENWKQYYKPINVGEKILIKPEWETVADTAGRVVFVSNPGMSFGTGTHESTQLCLELAENRIRGGESVLDLGSGSGILSIIAMLLGAAKATAVDIDDNAVKIALDNAALNGIHPPEYTALHGDIIANPELRERFAAEKYDVVFANIVADVIIALAPYTKGFLAEDGVLIASGIISDRLGEVKAALEAQGLTARQVCVKGDWAAILAV
jgi:ribosomal protein L11 methyltransferase